MFRPRLRIPSQPAGALLRQTTRQTSIRQRRALHMVPVLDQFSRDNAVPGLLSPAGFATAWTYNMFEIVDRLNQMTAGTSYENQDTLTILKHTARDSSQAALFNYASMAHNNAFFFRQLVNLNSLYEKQTVGPAEPPATADESQPPPLQQQQDQYQNQNQLPSSDSRIPPRLKTEIETHFSSVETLRLEFYNTALAMFGPGFIWLVKNANTTDLRILVTYLAGSPYTAAHWRRQSIDFNTSSGDAEQANQFFERSSTGAGNSGGRFEPQAPGGTDVIPLLCLSTWEHAWLTDYGIGGKGQFVGAWWDTIDWDKVEAMANPRRRDQFK
ncbi:manganese and iron superoxide dismutase [Nemania sp. FL0916]|nr:manganese and iron superoxide dismutase [Nemania sp. FL0916]